MQQKERECTIAIPVSVEMKGNAGNIKSEVFEYALEPADENSSTEAVFSEVGGDAGRNHKRQL